MSKSLIYLLALFILALASGGCETAEGVGKDMEKAGKKVQKAAN